jgi:hypothetical protein
MSSAEPTTWGDAVRQSEQNRRFAWSGPRRGPFLPYSGTSAAPSRQRCWWGDVTDPPKFTLVTCTPPVSDRILCHKRLPRSQAVEWRTGMANAGRHETWAGETGRHWAEHQNRHDAMQARLTAHLIAAAEISTADDVLDVDPSRPQLVSPICAARCGLVGGSPFCAGRRRNATRISPSQSMRSRPFSRTRLVALQATLARSPWPIPRACMICSRVPVSPISGSSPSSSRFVLVRMPTTPPNSYWSIPATQAMLAEPAAWVTR